MSSDLIKVVEYNPNTGRILSLRGYLTEEDVELLREPGAATLRGESPGEDRTHHIDLTDPDNPTPAERPASPVSRTDLTLLDVPAGSTLWINGASYPAEGTVELAFTYPGTYSLRVECFPFLDWVDEVTVP